MANRWGKSGSSNRFYFLGLLNHCGWWLQPWNKKMLALGKKAMTNLCLLSCFSCVQLFANLWTVAHQAPFSMGFSRQEYWSGLPFPSPGDLPHPGTEPMSLVLASGFFTAEPPEKAKYSVPLWYCWGMVIRHVCLYLINNRASRYF